MLEAFAVAAALAIEQSSPHERVTVSEQLFRAVFEASPVAISITGPDLTLHSVNPSYCRLLGRTPEELIGHSPLEFTWPGDRDTGAALRDRVSQTGEQSMLEKRYIHKDGRLITARLRLARLGEGTESGMLAQVEDITQAKEQEEALRFHATHDALTGLPNRTSVMDMLAAALERSTASHQLVAVLFCDLDRVKLINDTHGHATGDEYIRAVARRLRSALRGHDCVGRLGGDEFVVVAQHLASPTEVLGLAGRLMDAVRQPLQLGPAELAPSMSMGVAYELGGADTDAAQLVADADSAMYEAKTHGRGAWRVFKPNLRGPLLHLGLRHQIGPAIEQKQFELHYQPIVHLGDGRHVGHEALLRWRHPTHGMLAPGAFLDMIVDSEYEAPVTDWVIQQAAHDAANWPGGDRPFMSVNITAFQLAREDLPAVVAAALVDNGLDPQRMAVELTEDRFLEAALGASRLQALRDTGVLVSIDDVGTGFAGLGYVQRLPVNTLKVDRSFVSPLPSDEASNDIIAAICHLARARGLHVVAEGIETPAQLEALVRHGVGYGQGYHLGRPAPLRYYAAATSVPVPRAAVSLRP
ncbi:MAG: EAL domain-containing protein [Mycobacteriales bacterium]